MKKQTIRNLVTAGIIVLYWAYYYLSWNNKLQMPFVVSELYGAGEFLIYLLLLILSIDAIQKIKGKQNFRKNLLSGIFIGGMILIHTYCIYDLAHQYSLGGSLAIAQKEYVNGKPCLSIDLDEGEPLRVRCSKEIYEKIIVNSEVKYSMSIKYNSLRKSKAVLVRIDLKDYIDNRKNH